MGTSAHNKVAQTRFSNNDKEINPYPWPQLLMEAGTGHHAGKAEDCQRDRHPHLKGWAGTENRECNSENAVWEEVIRHFVQQKVYFIQEMNTHEWISDI